MNIKRDAYLQQLIEPRGRTLACGSCGRSPAESAGRGRLGGAASGASVNVVPSTDAGMSAVRAVWTA